MTSTVEAAARQICTIGRYAVFGEIAQGGMATVHYGRLIGAVGFARTVAIKRLHAQFARDAHFVSGLVDEARLAARIRHANVVATIDVESDNGELAVVMEYVSGESLAKLVRVSKDVMRAVPAPIAAGIIAGALHGLQAAHEAKTDRGQPLDLVHRDVSPQNILVGADGIPRIADFGVAKAMGKIQTTRAGQLKGKIRYMAPEQVVMQEVSPRTDIYAAGAVLWELLAGRRLITGANQTDYIQNIVDARFDPPSKYVPEISPKLDAIVMRAIAANAKQRFESARAFAIALEEDVGIATPRQIEAWVNEHAGEALARRAEELSAIEATTSPPAPPATLFTPSQRAIPAKILVSREPQRPAGEDTVDDSAVHAPPTMLELGGAKWEEDANPTQVARNVPSRGSRPARPASLEDDQPTRLEISTVKQALPRTPTPPTPAPPGPAAPAPRSVTKPIVTGVHNESPTLIPTGLKTSGVSPAPPRIPSRVEEPATRDPDEPDTDTGPSGVRFPDAPRPPVESLFAPATPPKRRIHPLLVAAGVLAVLIVPVALMALMKSAPQTPPPVVAPPQPAAKLTPEPDESETSTSAEAPVVERARREPKRAKDKSRGRTDCDPAYRIDEDGIRRIKPECL